MGGSGPSRGILKKTASNPQLVSNPVPNLNVVNIKKYLRDREIGIEGHDDGEEFLAERSGEDLLREPSPARSELSERSMVSEVSSIATKASQVHSKQVCLVLF